MKLRMEVFASDNTVAGTMFLDGVLKADKGELLTLNLLIDTAHLAPGNYRFDLLAYEQNDFGIQDWCDRVAGAPILDIVKRNDNDLDWLPQWWGHTQFHDLHLESRE